MTAPFSVIPHAETIFAPSEARACSTSGPGIGAPAHRKMRRLGIDLPDWVTARERSVRKGVDAIVKVAPDSRITSTARPGSQTSSSTALASSTIGIIRPYMKPVWCAIGEAISTMSSRPSRSRAA